MTQEELLRQLYDFTLVGDAPRVLELTNAGLEMGLGPETSIRVRSFVARIPIPLTNKYRASARTASYLNCTMR